VRLKEQIRGGGQEKGRRSGTLNVPAIVGFGKAVEFAIEEQDEEAERVRELRDELWEGLKSEIEGIKLNGHPKKRLPNNLNIAIRGVESQALIVQLKNILSLSRGSACTTGSVEASHVISAIDEKSAFSSVRIGLGRSNTKTQVNQAIKSIKKSVDKLKKMTLS
jgi:cysteine desulfurase